ncbi:glycosyltransferase family 1 protein [Actinotalea sp. K2]|uniref:glycosyltransferase family 4 protein n=1 Tax=Actinotalea sp. K2 TaxID=2939438 RepID=UPI0020172B84|nr:glycosyltransferase family 1 protein [Actinotalea sp. K2]MCL3862701.1 glycosyltransferase family 4 protein [Actinotalea sp. K2]
MIPPGQLTVAMTVEQLWQPFPGGSGTYIGELTRALATRDDLALEGIAARGSAPPAHPLPHSMTVRHSRLPRPLLYEAWSRYRLARVRPGSTDRVLHATTWAVPRRSSPLVVTVHDLAFLREPGHFTARGNAFFRRALDIVRDEADIIVVPSGTTARDCTEHGIEAGRIRVIHHGVRAESVGQDEVAAFRAAHGLHRPYLLWCGTFEPRKNLGALLEAYRLLVRNATELDLVLVGPTGWGGAAAEVTALAATLPSGRVHLLGRLGHHDLHRAYAGARTFCFPSTWEGFGMPVLEAMAHGVPVVTSTGTSMEEISPQGAVLVDPTATDELATGIEQASGTRHAELSRNAAHNAARFTWERSAELHIEAYRAAAASG